MVLMLVILTVPRIVSQVTELQLALEKAWKEVAEQKKISSGVDSKAELRLLETQQQLKIEHEEEIRSALHSTRMGK